MKNSEIGIDLVEISRIEAMDQTALINRILSSEEKKAYDAIKHPRRRLEFLAGRFAVKEAYTKVYQVFDEPVNMNDVTVLNNHQGAPYLKSPYRPQDVIKVSLSHTEQYVVAMCLCVKGD